jgi:hypothetical protein
MLLVFIIVIRYFFLPMRYYRNASSLLLEAMKWFSTCHSLGKLEERSARKLDV